MTTSPSILKAVVLLFSVICVVSSIQHGVKCIEKYAKCAVPLINNFGHPVNCRLAVPFMSCVVNVTEECYSHAVTDVKRYQNLTRLVCDTDAATQKEWKEASECLANNTSSFAKCTAANQPDESVCSAAYDSIVCFTSKTKRLCSKFASGIAEIVTTPFQILASECIDIEKDERRVENCLLNNSDKLLSCKLEGKFDRMGDICASVGNFTQCFAENVKEICGEYVESYVSIYTDGITFAMDMCKSLDFIKARRIPRCLKEYLKCNVQRFNVKERTCKDESDYVGCIADAAKICQGKKPDSLHVIALQKYKTKFPDYCKQDSAFHKNIEEKSECITNSSSNVVGICYRNLEKDKEGVSISDTAGKLRAYVNFLNCLSKGFEKPCGKEAESAVNELLNPLEQSMDERCRQLTGKKCNGANVLAAGMWILIAALTFLLTQKHE